jgi:uncharacterized protein (TIGR02271 family)
VTTQTDTGNTQSTPLIQEFLEIEKQKVETGIVRVRKITHETEQTSNISLQKQSVDVTHVPINKIVEKAFEPYLKENTWVVPVFEEVVIKQILLKEEVHITVHHEQQEVRQNFKLKNEEAVIERFDSESGEWDTHAS